MNENDFKERKPAGVLQMRATKSAAENTLPPTPGPHKVPRPRPVESVNARAEILFVNSQGWKLVRSFVSLGSVAKVARCYGTRCATVEQALVDELRQRRAA